MENVGTASQGEGAAGRKGTVFLEDGVGGGLGWDKKLEGPRRADLSKGCCF